MPRDLLEKLRDRLKSKKDAYSSDLKIPIVIERVRGGILQPDETLNYDLAAFVTFAEKIRSLGGRSLCETDAIAPKLPQL